jgi:hypothetical protein
MPKAVVCPRLLHNEGDEEGETDQPWRSIIQQLRIHVVCKFKDYLYPTSGYQKREYAEIPLKAISHAPDIHIPLSRTSCRCYTSIYYSSNQEDCFVYLPIASEDSRL